jgi:uncharacterized protein YllA (UPF0747 family)
LVVKIKEFSSVEEFEEAIDKEISDTKSKLGGYLRRLDEIRELAEKTKKIRQVVMKLAGKRADVESSGEIILDNVNIVLEASPLDELTVLESVVRSHQERLLKFQKTRENLKPLDEFNETEGMNFLIVENDGVPERILLKIS